VSGLGNKDIMAKNLNYYLNNSSKDAADVCRDLKIATSTFSDWVNGKKYPKMDNIDRIADYFGVKKSDLIEDNEKGGTYEKIHYIKQIPLLGFVPGGPPMLAAESYDEYIPVTDASLDYALKVIGDSMINVRIQDGDTVFIDKDASINNGDIVVALINDTEATLKRFYLYGDVVVLRPENPNMQERQYPASEVRVLGKVKKVVYEL